MTDKNNNTEDKSQAERDEPNGTHPFDIGMKNRVERDDNNDAPQFDVIVVGGGLSGLSVARNLNGSTIENNIGVRRKLRWKLFEANSRIGGRLQNDDSGNRRNRYIDLGAAWVWPPHQPEIMKALVNSPTLGIRTFLQPGEDYYSSETTRIVGGAVEFVNKIYDELLTTNNEDDCHSNLADVQTNCPITVIRRNPDRSISVELASGKIFRTLHVVLAAPPKIFSTKVSFEPELPPAKSTAMSSSQTWMAGVTKVALVYRKFPEFWPLLVNEGERLLSAKHRRPAFQVYDGSPFLSLSSSMTDDSNKEETTEKTSVLTFFTLASLSNRNNNDEMLARDCAEQMCESLSTDTIRKVPVLAKCIRSFDEFCVKRWPLEQYISNNKDPTGITPHPRPIPELAKSEWDGTLLFAGTETDQSSPGVMEGAVGAANRVTKELAEKLSLSLVE
mmetsp:Transcript_27660/g.60909  ORF Transcript_27660/g.60909 Transcript_27660/m.60909 type:complete len:445 (+) Transcript_27660:41-1375(+)